MGSLEKQDSSITDPGIETIKHLADTNFSQAVELKKTVYSNKTVTREEVDTWDPDWVTRGKLELVLHQFKSKKSPGPDGLRPVLLQHLSLIHI